MNESPSPAPAPPPFSRTQVAGAVLLLAAVALYVSNCRTERAQDATVALVRGIAANAAPGIGIALPAEGTNAPAFRPALPEVSEAVLKALASAEVPPDRAAAKAAVPVLDLRLVVTNAAQPQRADLRVSRAPGAAQAFVRPVGEGAERFEPVVVDGLGKTLDAAAPETFGSLLAAPKPAAVVEVRPAFPGDAGTPAETLDAADAAASLRALGASGEGFFLLSKEPDATNDAARVFVAVPAARAERIREAFRAAETTVFPTNAPDEMVKGDLYSLHFYYRGEPAWCLWMQAAVLEADAAGAYVRFVSGAPVGPGPARASDTALAPGLAETLAETWAELSRKP